MKTRLILHSDQSRNLTLETDRRLLRSLTGKRAPRVGYIPSCPDPRRRHFRDKEAYYKEAGAADVLFFDPSEPSGKEELSAILSCDVLHLSGGVVTSFRWTLAETGFDAHLLAFAAKGGVLLGVSAGAMLLGKSFGLAALYGEKGPFEGLGLVDFEVFPHRKEMATRMGSVRDYVARSGRSVWAIDDGEVVIVNGPKVTKVGEPELLLGR